MQEVSLTKRDREDGAEEGGEDDLKRQKTEVEEESEENDDEPSESSEHELLLEQEELAWDGAVPPDFEDGWDGGHVRRPCASKFMYRRKGSDEKLSKWELIVTSLTAKGITFVAGLLSSVNAYQTTPRFMPTLRAALKETDRRVFFVSTLPRIIGLVLRTPELLKSPIPLLLGEGSVSVTRLQCACIVANMFLGTFPTTQGPPGSCFPTIDFFRLFAMPSPSNVAKLLCVMHYFSSPLAPEQESELVTFERFEMGAEDAHFFLSCEKKVTKKLEIVETGGIEESTMAGQNGVVEVDFANKLLGGGVLGNGCIQEEIRFAIAPELLVARLLVSELRDNDCVMMTGARIVAQTTGYSDAFRFVGPLNVPVAGTVLAIDALQFGATQRAAQWEEAKVLREANKALNGFFHVPKKSVIATGNWGTGFYGGDVELKSLLQLLCATIAGKPLRYHCFGHSFRLAEVHARLVAQKATVGSVFSVILGHRPAEGELSLFDKLLAEH
jgi:poly(ADP-ribose) glycohydrolase